LLSRTPLIINEVGLRAPERVQVLFAFLLLRVKLELQLGNHICLFISPLLRSRVSLPEILSVTVILHTIYPFSCLLASTAYCSAPRPPQRVIPSLQYSIVRHITNIVK